MKKKISTLLVALIFVIGITACSSQKMATIKDTSKVLATVEGKNITQQMVDMARTNSTFTEKQMIEKLLDDELILLKAKELKITVTDKEAKAEAKKQRNLYEDTLQKADNKDEVKATMDDFIKKLGITEEEYWNSYVVQAYKNALILGKTREKLGTDTEKTLKELRAKAKINYYN
ncbi:hypothetical protein HMPREF1982_01336 [Clostridiales bacterium oral taxon 876 str. F0540]|nr:hypothetical protein HMPREF1982_01336 [Clostridiales bacterium oral taxon 876 str. F0540]